MGKVSFLDYKKRVLSTYNVRLAIAQR